MKTLAGYLRVSHVGGRDADSFHSPAEQTAEIEAWANTRGHRVEILPPELDGKGSDASRPIFRQAVDGVKAGLYGGVVVAYLSRAGRDLRLMLDLWDEVEAVGGNIYSARENIDASTASGRLHRNLLASIDQHQLEERRDGFDRARKGAVERGIWQRRQTPRGYDKDPATRRLVPDEDPDSDRNADSVRKAADAFLGSVTISELARRLKMTQGGVRAMLRNRVYLGELRVGKHINVDAHPAILQPEIFEAVQVKLDSAPRPPRGSRPPSLLGGLVRCMSCGHVMTRGRSGQDIVYRCPAKHSGVRCPAPVAISSGRLDPHVEAIAIIELGRLKVTAADGSQVGDAQRLVAEAEAEMSGYLEAVAIAELGAADAASGMKARREKLDAARETLRSELARAPTLPKVEGAAEVWPDLDAHERNDLLRCLLATVIIRPVGPGKRVDVAERARVLRYGADIRLPAGRTGSPSGLVPLPWPDADGVDVLGIPLGEDPL